MPNRGNLNWSSSNTTYSVQPGYYSGGTLDSRTSYTNGYNSGYNKGKEDSIKIDNVIDLLYRKGKNWPQGITTTMNFNDGDGNHTVYAINIGTNANYVIWLSKFGPRSNSDDYGAYNWDYTRKYPLDSKQFLNDTKIDKESGPYGSYDTIVQDQDSAFGLMIAKGEKFKYYIYSCVGTSGIVFDAHREETYQDYYIYYHTNGFLYIWYKRHFIRGASSNGAYTPLDQTDYFGVNPNGQYLLI